MTCPNAELQDLAELIKGKEASPTHKLDALLSFLAKQNAEILAMKGALSELYMSPDDSEYGPISDDGEPFVSAIDHWNGAKVSFSLSQITLLRWDTNGLKVYLKGYVDDGCNVFILLERKAGKRLEDIISGHKSIINLVFPEDQSESES